MKGNIIMYYLLALILIMLSAYYWLGIAYPSCMEVFNDSLYCLIRG